MITVVSAEISFADKPTLTGDLVVLRPVRASDAPALAASARDPDVNRLTGTHGRHSLEELAGWYASRAGHEDRLDLAIVERATGETVGEAVLNGLDVHNRSCGFRIALFSRRFFGRGLGTEASRMIVAHAFEAVGLHRIALEVYAFNPRARHVYEKIGFVSEGVHRQALRWQGEWIDAYTMAIMADDWARHRGYPANGKRAGHRGDVPGAPPGAILADMIGSEQKANLHRLLQAGRDALLWKLDGLSEYDLRRPVVPTGTNLLGLVKHLASVEAGYFGETFGRPFTEPMPWLAEDAEPNADMWATAEQTRDWVIGLCQRVWAHSDATIEALPLDGLGNVPWWPPEHREVTLHQILVYMIAETHRHAGHADIVRELIDGAIGLREGNENLPRGDQAWWESYRARLQQVAEQAR